MTYIQQSGTGQGNEYLVLEPDDPVYYNFLYSLGGGGSGVLVNIMQEDWLEKYKSTNMDAVYKGTYSYVLKPNRKVLVEVQFYPAYFDDVGISGKYVNLRVGLCNTTLTANNQYARS